MNHKSLLDLFTPPEGYGFCQGVGCTYSVNDKTMSALKGKLGIHLNKTAMTKFEAGDSFRLFFSQGKYEGTKAPNYLIPVSVDGGCLHAKVYLLAYEKDKSFIQRVIVASGNLTNAEEMNVYAVKDFPITDSQNLIKLEEINSVDLLLAGVKGLLEDDFFYSQSKAKENTEKLEIVTPLPKPESGATIIVSPFLTDSTVLEIFGFTKPVAKDSVQDKHLVSRKDAIDALSEEVKNSGMKFYILENPEAEEGTEEKNIPPTALHSKMYIYKKHFYLGSANCTNSAFHKNIECLVRIEETIVEGFLNGYARYEPEFLSKEAQVALIAQKEFEQNCREIVGSFSSNAETYSVTGKEGYEITLSGAEGMMKIDENTWERTEETRHMVTLRINKDPYEASFPLMVEGGASKIDEKAIENMVEESLIARLALGSRGNHVGSTKRNSENSGGSQQNKSGYTTKSVISQVLKVKTHKDAENMQKNISDLLKEITPEGEFYQTLINAKEALETIYPQDFPQKEETTHE